MHSTRVVASTVTASIRSIATRGLRTVNHRHVRAIAGTRIATIHRTGVSVIASVTALVVYDAVVGLVPRTRPHGTRRFAGIRGGTAGTASFHGSVRAITGIAPVRRAGIVIVAGGGRIFRRALHVAHGNRGTTLVECCAP